MSSPTDCEPSSIGLVNLLWALGALKLPVLHVFEAFGRHLILSNEDTRVVWVFIRPPTPWNSRPNSLDDEVVQIERMAGLG